MSKKFYCAKCGKKLEVIQKAKSDESELPKEVSTKGGFEILDEENEKKIDKKIDKLFNEFPFVQKINKGNAEHEVVTQESGDKRSKNHLREELVTSSAPLNVLNIAKSSVSTPNHDLVEP